MITASFGFAQGRIRRSNVNNLQTTPKMLDKVNYLTILDFIK